MLAPAALAHHDVACFAGLSARQNKQHQRKGVVYKQAVMREGDLKVALKQAG
jgi:hypothetical protein